MHKVSPIISIVLIGGLLSCREGKPPSEVISDEEQRPEVLILMDETNYEVFPLNSLLKPRRGTLRSNNIGYSDGDRSVQIYWDKITGGEHKYKFVVSSGGIETTSEFEVSDTPVLLAKSPFTVFVGCDLEESIISFR